MNHIDARIARHRTVSTKLSLLSDGQLAALVRRASPHGSGIGGTTATLDVDGDQVFSKHVPLTDLERRAANVQSTANLFSLPTHCQYGVPASEIGVASSGCGVWRELATHVMTTNWVLGKQHASFPLMYHWRVLPGSVRRLPADHLERTVAYWNGSSTVRERFEAVASSSACVSLFLERLPHTLADWLDARIAQGGAALESAGAMIDEGLTATLAFMTSRGLQHFDAHFANILTDGERVYFGDFGLALSDRFDLSADESRFFVEHALHDRSYAMSEFYSALHETAAGAIVERYKPVVEILSRFYRQLRTESRTTPYPARELARAWELVDARTPVSATPAADR